MAADCTHYQEEIWWRKREGARGHKGVRYSAHREQLEVLNNLPSGLDMIDMTNLDNVCGGGGGGYGYRSIVKEVASH